VAQARRCRRQPLGRSHLGVVRYVTPGPPQFRTAPGRAFPNDRCGTSTILMPWPSRTAPTATAKHRRTGRRRFGLRQRTRVAEETTVRIEALFPDRHRRLLRIVGAIYWFWSYEQGGTVMLAGTTLLGLLPGSYYLWWSTRMKPRPEDRTDATIEEGTGVIGSFPSSSIWPFILAWACSSSCCPWCSGSGCCPRGRPRDICSRRCHRREQAGWNRLTRKRLHRSPSGRYPSGRYPSGRSPWGRYQARR